MTRPVSVDELVRAHHAVLAGQFRRHRTPRLHSVWDPAGPVLPVLGAGGGTGATTVALALATAAGAGRVVECAPPGASGLTAAPDRRAGGAPFAGGCAAPVTPSWSNASPSLCCRRARCRSRRRRGSSPR